MTRHAPLWQQANTYQAKLDRELFAALWPTAGGCNGGKTSLVAGTWTAEVAPGVAAVPLADGGCALCRWDAPEVMAFTPPVSQPRSDLIVVQVRDTELDAGANNDFIITTVPGVEGAPNEPVPPNAFLLCLLTLTPGAPSIDVGTSLVWDESGSRPLSVPRVTLTHVSAAPCHVGIINGLVPVVSYEGLFGATIEASGVIRLPLTVMEYQFGWNCINVQEAYADVAVGRQITPLSAGQGQAYLDTALYQVKERDGSIAATGGYIAFITRIVGN
jgi:hypothetical protein